MKKLLTLTLAAVITAAVSFTAWAGEIPTTVEVAADAVLDGVAGEDRELIMDLLEMLPGSGVFEMLDGTAVMIGPELANGRISENAGRRELSFTEGFIPKGSEDEARISSDKVTVTRITRTPEYFEASFSFISEGVKTEYRAQMNMKDDNGTMKCALQKIWQDQTEFETFEAVSEVFEDYYEEVIEPLY